MLISHKLPVNVVSHRAFQTTKQTAQLEHSKLGGKKWMESKISQANRSDITHYGSMVAERYIYRSMKMVEFFDGFFMDR